jgi:hypothetical protein
MMSVVPMMSVVTEAAVVAMTSAAMTSETMMPMMATSTVVTEAAVVAMTAAAMTGETMMSMVPAASMMTEAAMMSMMSTARSMVAVLHGTVVAVVVTGKLVMTLRRPAAAGMSMLAAERGPTALTGLSPVSAAVVPSVHGRRMCVRTAVAMGMTTVPALAMPELAVSTLATLAAFAVTVVSGEAMAPIGATFRPTAALSLALPASLTVLAAAGPGGALGSTLRPSGGLLPLAPGPAVIAVVLVRVATAGIATIGAARTLGDVVISDVVISIVGPAIGSIPCCGIVSGGAISRATIALGGETPAPRLPMSAGATVPVLETRSAAGPISVAAACSLTRNVARGRCIAGGCDIAGGCGIARGQCIDRWQCRVVGLQCRRHQQRDPETA